MEPLPLGEHGNPIIGRDDYGATVAFQDCPPARFKGIPIAWDEDLSA